MSHSVLARELMSHPVRRLTTHATVRDAAEFLLRHGISGAPAVDEHGQWQGVFTMNDIARYVASRVVRHHETQSLEARAPVTDSSRSDLEQFGATRVEEVMTRGLVTVFPSATLDQVVRSMHAFKVHRVFVIDEKQNEIEGVITTLDVIRWLNASGKG
jgi:tRNA nucleotidyltransferase (CCA-adding enzyme)